MSARATLPALRRLAWATMIGCALAVLAVMTLVVAFRTTRSPFALRCISRYLTWDGMTMGQLQSLIGGSGSPHDMQGRYVGYPGFDPTCVELGYQVVSSRRRPDGKSYTYHVGFVFENGRLRKASRDQDDAPEPLFH